MQAKKKVDWFNFFIFELSGEADRASEDVARVRGKTVENVHKSYGYTDKADLRIYFEVDKSLLNSFRLRCYLANRFC